MRPFTPKARSFSGPPSRGATPVKSILKPSSILGRRKEMHHASSDPSEPVESPSKRRKVLFDDIRNVTYEVGDRTMDDVKREVRFALEEHLRGNDGQYDMLKELFANDKNRYLPPVVGEEEDTPKPHELQVYVKGLTSCIPMLKGRECNGLVNIILKCAWLGRDDGFVRVFTHFLAALVSAQGSYLVPVLSMMVEKFRLSRPSTWSVSDFPEIDRETMRERLHSTMQYLLQMFPAAVTVLENLMSTKFPFPDESVRIQMAYVRNLLHVKDYVPDLRNEILDIILNRVVMIDSQMQVDLDDLDDNVTAAAMCALQDDQRRALDWEDDDGDDSDDESVDSDEVDYDEEALKIKTVKSKVETLDAMLDTLFTLFSPHFTQPGSDKAFSMFEVMLREFDDIVLPTYRSRHSQFLVFHFAQQHERLTDAFCGQLIATAFQGNAPVVLRQSAAAYLASFVARGALVPGSLVRTIFLLLVHHLEQYRRKYEPLCRGPDLNRFHPYYSLVQATLYIFCFRWQDLVTSAPDTVDVEDATSYLGHDLEWVGASKRDLSMQVFGKLNPLKVCAPVIVDEFAKLAHRLNFLYIYPLVESNKRLRLSQFLSSTYAAGRALRDASYEGQEESFHQLDPFFPFDPYQLPVSKRWVDEDYVQWKRVRGLNAEDDSDSDDGDGDALDGDEGQDEIEEATATDCDEDESD
ncbi:hypothetical protein XA68_15069 [Ophiocordyceps unilateralis]|uniref:RNA polymerase I-specific transcription initiation factor RRN3 n=1 Tax=Ophiocordyceps unilateralis TaxID=268505 RepID=A0A2A9PL68_OPHUN|nr:hypothetical protein XA68_15069 [Ophiocordyceps unilateralis]